MLGLKSSCLFDIDMEIENNYLLNDNLYKLIFEFCDAEDLCQISFCSKKFNEISKQLDYKFHSIFEDNYCSSYNNYE
jgi:hypothetical protein